MSDSLPRTWHCPSCGRRVPTHVDTCRCGLGRDQAETTHPEAETSQPSAAPATEATSLKKHVTAFVVVAAVALALAVTGAVMLSRGERPKTGADVRVLSRLDDYTRSAGPGVRNTIPAFLAAPGRVGVMEGGSPTIKDLSEAELRKGTCSPSVALLVRQQYPGEYDDWPDAKLERAVVAKHPEYR